MTATRAITTPISLAAIVLLVINDHVLKTHIPGVVTGKLSDFAGMIFFPLLVAAALEHAGVRRGQRTVIAAAIATGLVFAAIKLWDPAGDVYRLGLAALQWPFRAIAAVVQSHDLPSLGRAQLVADPTDLVAMPALAIPVWLCSVSTGAHQLHRRRAASRADRVPAMATIANSKTDEGDLPIRISGSRASGRRCHA